VICNAINTQSSVFLVNERSGNDNDNGNDAIHAIMIMDHSRGGVLLESQMKLGSFIRIQDELSLLDSELWINDRGYDADADSDSESKDKDDSASTTRTMVYGNWDGVPYQMARVASLVPHTLPTALGQPAALPLEYTLEHSHPNGHGHQNGRLRFEREIVDADLSWTMGDGWRSPEEYESKMAAVGGITTRMNRNKDPPQSK
jgi:hypothetical protein